MATVLVVDDSLADRHVAQRMLEEAGLTVQAAADGREALDQIALSLPDLVLTDLQMPTIDGLELVRRVTTEHPAVPIIVMTAYGSEDISVKALRTGAASYVPKHNLTRDLVDTVKMVLAVAGAKRGMKPIAEVLQRQETEYVLNSTLDGLDPLIAYMKDFMRQTHLFGEAEILRVSTALYEALVNAVEHGNLEITSDERDRQGREYGRFLRNRACCTPFCNRNVYLRTQLGNDEVIFKVRDEGAGFDTASLPDPTASDNVDRTNGRGLFLIRTFMDEVRFNDAGTEITMVKRRTIGSAE